MSAGRYVAGSAERGYTVCFSVYDGARGVAFEARASLCASVIAVFTAVVVLPSEGCDDVTNIDCGGLPADENSSDVRR